MLGQSNTMETKNMIRTSLVAGILGSALMLAGCGGEDAATTATPAPSPAAQVPSWRQISLPTGALHSGLNQRK